MKKKLTKEEINALPLFKYTKKIQLITNEKDAEKYCELLKKEELLGFDTESRPSFSKKDNFGVALVQLATPECTYLFRTCIMDFPKCLAEIFMDANIKKIGIATHDDVKFMKKLYHFEAQSMIDLAKISKQKKLEAFGLRTLSGLLLGKRLSKGAKLTNWENPKLTEPQLKYAALDAWVCLEVYRELNKL